MTFIVVMYINYSIKVLLNLITTFSLKKVSLSIVVQNLVFCAVLILWVFTVKIYAPWSITPYQ